MQFDPQAFSTKRRSFRDTHHTYKITNDTSKPKFYVLDMFPYPSGAGLHVGHPLGYIASDIYSRYMRMKGFNVLHPMGFDAFGLPAEQYAIQTGTHPAAATAKNIDTYKKQLENLGLSYDWSREVNTSEQGYYKWTQWIFLKLFTHYYDPNIQKARPITELVAQFEKQGNIGVHAANSQKEQFTADQRAGFSPKQKDDVLMNYRLAYRNTGYVNRCEALNTVLANDEVKNGVSERGGHPVERREMKQWALRITAYVNRLLDDLETLERSDALKAMQKNWIGKSEGAEIDFVIQGKTISSETNVLILHGYHDDANAGWRKWLTDKCLEANIPCYNPQCDHEDSLSLDKDLETIISQYGDKINEHTIIVGYSLGGYTAKQLIMKVGKKIATLITVASSFSRPAFGDDANETELLAYRDTPIDYDKVNSLIGTHKAYFSKDDPAIEYDLAIADRAKNYPAATIHTYEDKGHFSKHFGVEELPDVRLDIKNATNDSHKVDSSLRSEGQGNDGMTEGQKITVFTTRPDTLFGVTAIVMAPEIASIDANIPQEYSAGVEEYRKATSQKSEVERQQDAETKSGVFSGVYAIHPLTNAQVPIWFADYVLPDYATGAVMFVPAHDERDFDFAKKHGLPIVDVIAKHYISGNKPEPTKETTIRQNVLAMLYNQDKTKILCLDWITNDWKSFIMGGVEENETFEEAGKREIMEESGYTNIEVLGTVRGEIHAEYFAAHKDINRYSKERCVMYRLLGEENTGVREGEKDHHLVWKPVEEVKEFLANTPGENNSNLIFFQRYLAENQAYTDEGVLINSGEFDGMKNSDAKKAITAHLEKEGKGRMHISFKLRDASFSRQRYWGEPIPVEYDADGVAYPIDESELPLVLPVLDNFQGVAGKSPLSNAPDRVSHNGRTRETDTMPGYAGSSWYYLRYMDPTNADAFVSKDAINYWQNVDLYIGGTEHAVGHLMYSRFWHKFLYDIGHVSTTEPFKKLFNQGMIEGVIEYLYFRKAKQDGKTVFVTAALVNKNNKDEFSELPIHISYVRDYGMQSSYIDQESIKGLIEWRPDFGNALFEHADGIYDPSNPSDASAKQEFRILTRSENGKMSKSYYNVINPDSVIGEYGADCFRMYEMFLGPVNQSKPWNMNGIDGVYKFLKKVWALCCDEHGLLKLDDVTPSPAELKIIHTCIKKVDNDIVNMSLNTCISNFMITVNGLKDVGCKNKQVIEMLLRVLAPFAPFITEELRSALGHTESIHTATYPAFDEKYLVEDEVTYPFCINGKRKTEIILPASMSVPDIQKHVLTLDIAQKFIDGKPIKQLIVVPGRMINVVL